MKNKGIPFWEQHLEHLVIGVAVLAFLGLVAMQFIGSPNAVEVQKAGVVGPSEIDGLLERDARALADLLAPSADSPLPELAAPTPVAAAFEQLRLAQVSPSAQVIAMAPALNPVPEIGGAPPGAPFVVAAVPAPIELAREQFFDTFTDTVMEEFPALKPIFPKKPYDVMWTTVAGRFNVASVIEQFKKSGPNGEAPLPSTWYNERVDFIDVKLERQELVAGQWTNDAIIDALPGTYLADLRSTLATQKVDATMRNGIIAQVADPSVRSQVIQPEFYETKSDSWFPPVAGAHVAVAGGGGAAAAAAVVDQAQAKIQELKDSLDKAKKERDRLLKKISDNRCPAEAKPPADTKGGRGSTSPGGGDAPSGSRGVSDPGASPGTVDLAECAKLRKRVKVFEKLIKKIEDELAQLEPTVQVDEKPVEEVVKPVQALPDVVDVWAHDMTIQPNRTYRYRLVVEVYNPLFAKKLDLPEAQQTLAEQFTLKSAPSEWTQPITTGSWLQVFITEAMPAAPGGPMAGVLGQAKAEVFRFSDGQWWSQRFPVQPGDRIGGTEDSGKAPQPDGGAPPVNFATDWFVLDVIENIDADKAMLVRNWGATVLLQDLAHEDVSQLRHPQQDSTSPLLKRLREQVNLSKLADATADAK